MKSKIDKIQELINEKINSIVDQILVLQQDLKTEKCRLLKLEDELQKTIAFKNFLNFISGVTRITQFLLPQTIPYLRLVDLVTTFINPLISDTEYTECKLHTLPDSVKLFEENIGEFIQTIIQEKNRN